MARRTFSLIDMAQGLLKDLDLRSRIELATFALIALFALSVLTLGHTSRATLTYDGGKITYTGQVKNHRMNGQGKLTYENGDTYEGELVNGVFSGQGKFVSKNGWSYEGEFQNGQPHGQGRLIAKDKQIFQGTFKQGIYQK